MTQLKKCYSLIRNKYLWILVIMLSVFTGVIAAQQDISCYHCHTKVVTEFRNNVHYDKGFNCADCHGGTDVSNASVVSYSVMSGNFIGRPNRENITDICSKCHEAETKDYKTSIHWDAIKQGHPDAATCTDCHGVHEIRAIKDPNSSSNHQNSPATCAKCHSNKEMMSAWYYGIKADRFDTYKESFHWRALDKGYALVATCADCHENHKTKSHTDPTSSTFPENLPNTCGKANCHAGVNFDAKVATGLVHDKESLHTGELVFNKTGLSPQMKEYFFGPFDLAYWIAIFFKILTTGVIGFFTGMVILDFFSRLKIKRRF
ncbi:MAG: cytochrome c3 family protein [Candidatus Methanoperedens sp.]|nr:cytochrome c3 family protein [Candidatus Methanoperedens sp.]